MKASLAVAILLLSLISHFQSAVNKTFKCFYFSTCCITLHCHKFHIYCYNFHNFYLVYVHFHSMFLHKFYEVRYYIFLLFSIKTGIIKLSKDPVRFTFVPRILIASLSSSEYITCVHIQDTYTSVQLENNIGVDLNDSYIAYSNVSRIDGSSVCTLCT